MSTFLVAILAFGVVMAAMAVGVIFSNREIKGSCGGLQNLRTENGEAFCELCGLPADERCTKLP